MMVSFLEVVKSEQNLNGVNKLVSSVWMMDILIRGNSKSYIYIPEESNQMCRWYNKGAVEMDCNGPEEEEKMRDQKGTGSEMFGAFWSLKGH